MTKTVELTDLVIKSIHLNYEMQYVRVLFSMVDECRSGVAERGRLFLGYDTHC